MTASDGPAPAPVELTLYGRDGCHLCERMLQELRALRREFDFVVTEVDVDSARELHARYDRDVPVLAAGARELCRHFLDASKVRDYLGDFR